MRRLYLVSTVVIALASGVGSTVNAQSLGVNYTNAHAPASSNVSFYNLGFEFRVNVNLTVTGLGDFDYGSLSFLGKTQEVGLWSVVGNNSIGPLIASAFVGSGSTQIGSWAFTTIAATTLLAGNEYIVGAQGGAPFVSGVPITVNPDINYVEDRFSTTSTTTDSPLIAPNGSEGMTSTSDAGYFGGNIEIGAIPEPSACALMLAGLGLIGIAALRRKSRPG
jgi:hypothetical protein